MKIVEIDDDGTRHLASYPLAWKKEVIKLAKDGLTQTQITRKVKGLRMSQVSNILSRAKKAGLIPYAKKKEKKSGWYWEKEKTKPPFNAKDIQRCKSCGAKVMMPCFLCSTLEIENDK